MKVEHLYHKGPLIRIAIFTNVMYHKEWILSVLAGKEEAFWSEEDSIKTKNNIDTKTNKGAVCHRF